MKMPINVLAKKIEFRSMPSLLEQRNNLLDEADGLLKKSKQESRAFSDEESTRFDEIKKEIAKIDKTLAAEEEARTFEKKKSVILSEEEKRALEIEKEERAFIDFLVEGRATNLPAGTNGSVIPVSIASKIVEKVKELSPLYSMATKYDVTGALNIPAYDWNDHTTAYQGAEFTAISSSAGAFTNISLQGFVIGSLALISKSLINRTDVNVVPFVIDQIAKSIANFLEKELITGTVASAKMQGLVTISAGQTTTSATTLVIAPEELVKLKRKIPSIYQGSASWLMHPDTLSYLQSLKDTTGKFLFGNDLSQAGADMILSKPVYLSENMPKIGVGAYEIFYGDFSGLAVKVEQGVEVQVLLEKYADQHAIGVVVWASMDSKIAEPQKIVALKGL